MMALLRASSGPVLGQAFVAQFAARRFSRPFVEIDSRPVLTIAAPMPRIFVLTFPVSHSRFPRDYQGMTLARPSANLESDARCREGPV